jgi:hypothetical protein
VIQARREADTFRKCLETFTASSAPGQINESRFRFEGDFEIPYFASQFDQFREGQKLDMKLPPALGKAGRDGAEIAVVGGEGSIQLGHEAANGRSLVDQHHLFTCLRQVQCGFDASQAAADD